MTVPHIFGTLTGASPIDVPVSELDENFAFLSNQIGSQISVTDYGAVADSGTNNAAAFAATIAAALAAGKGNTVYVPAGGASYLVNSTITIPQDVNIRIDGLIEPGASMTDLIKVTANAGTFVYGTGTLANISSRAANGITFNPLVAGNNRNFLQGLEVFGFVNNIRNVNADYIAIQNVFSQNATGNTLYATAGTGSLIDGLKVLGDANGIYYSGTPIEGVVISNCQLLTTAVDAYAIKFDQGAGYSLQISNTIVQGSVILDGSVSGTSNVDINALYISLVGGTSATTVGMDLIGNCTDIKINGLTAGLCPKAGLRISDTASFSPRRVYVTNFIGLSNGTAAGSADLLISSSHGGVGEIFVRKSSFQSTGGSVKSVLETGGGTVLSTYENSNTYAATSTFINANSAPVSGGVPYVDANGFQHYSAVLGSGNVLIGGGAGNPPSSVPNVSWNSGTGNLEIAGGFRSERVSGVCFTADLITTNPAYYLVSGSGNAGVFGTEGSAAGATWTGTNAYATLIGGSSGDTQFATANVVRGGVNNGGLYSNTVISTGAPSGSSAGGWKLGAIQAGAVTPDTTRSVFIDIGGVVYKLIVAA